MPDRPGRRAARKCPLSTYRRSCRITTAGVSKYPLYILCPTNPLTLSSSDNRSLSPPASGARFASCPLLGLFPLVITLHYGQQCARPLQLMPEGWYVLSAAHVQRVRFA